MADRDHVVRANRATQLLEDPLLIEMFAQAEQAAYAELLSARGWGADRKRRALVERINIIREIPDHLRTVVALGQTASRTRPGVA
jgi:hypothetical protein